MMNKNKKIKVKTKDQEIKELLTDLEKDLSNFKRENNNKDRKLKEYIRLLEVARNKCRKVVQENNLLKRQILGLTQTKPKQKKKKQIKRKYTVEDSDNETDSPYKSDYQENEEKEEDQYPEIKEKKVKTIPNQKKNKSY